MDTIDAVTTEEMGRKAYSTRVEFEMDGILNTDTFYTMERIMTSRKDGSRSSRIYRKGIHILSTRG
jgi:hypothetical protein